MALHQSYLIEWAEATSINRGTILNTSGTNTEYTIDTGLTSIKEFWLHGYSTNSSYEYTMQLATYYTADDAGYFQIVSKYGSNGESNRYAIGQSSLGRGYSIKSIVGGVVTIISPSVIAWTTNNLNWSAYGDGVSNTETLEGTFEGSRKLQYTVTSQLGKVPKLAYLQKNESSNQGHCVWMKPNTVFMSAVGNGGGVNAFNTSGSESSTRTSIVNVTSDSVIFQLPTSESYWPGTWKYHVEFE